MKKHIALLLLLFTTVEINSLHAMEYESAPYILPQTDSETQETGIQTEPEWKTIEVKKDNTIPLSTYICAAITLIGAGGCIYNLIKMANATKEIQKLCRRTRNQEFTTPYGSLAINKKYYHQILANIFALVGIAGIAGTTITTYNNWDNVKAHLNTIFRSLDLRSEPEKGMLAPFLKKESHPAA